MVILVRSLVQACDTNAQGSALFDAIKGTLNSGSNVCLDFSGIHGMTSSFVNCAFIPLLDEISYDDLKARLALKNANRQIGNMLKDRIAVHAKRVKQAA